MSTATPQRETFLPEGHAARLAEVGEFLLRQTSIGYPDPTAYALVSIDGREQVTVPAELHRVLLQHQLAREATQVQLSFDTPPGLSIGLRLPLSHDLTRRRMPGVHSNGGTPAYLANTSPDGIGKFSIDIPDKSKRWEGTSKPGPARPGAVRA